MHRPVKQLQLQIHSKPVRRQHQQQKSPSSKPVRRQHQQQHSGATNGGLLPPKLSSNEPVTGQTKDKLRKENKRKRLKKLLRQHEQEWWTTQQGEFSIPVSKQAPSQFRGQMCPSGLALHHPAADLLLEYATRGCPAKTGAQWTKEEVTAAVEHGNHSSAEVDTARIQFRAEALDKQKLGQCRIVNWDDIRDNPPAEMKVSPLSAVPHKS